MSGQSVGGIIGGAIGFIWGPVGAQIGFAIGSMVGGYVDPVKVKGPRLTDATTQTSTVGGVIPFGYGTFVTAGNVIWRGDLKEHKKTQRQGKGGGAKTTTYTYTRSYAVGVCQGAIYGFRWIKRNGKKVYTSDPNATAEERAYSAKWLQKCTLYTGTETQMPDSTIVAREGVGNVSAFHGLAYIVVEDDDLTDLSGAIPQYEFCINATPPEAYLTSHPYPQYLDDSLKVEPLFLSANVRQVMIEWPQPAESLAVEPNYISAGTRPVQWAFNQYPEMLSVAPNFISAATKSIQVTYNHPAEDLLIATPNFIGASTKQVLYQNFIPVESLSVTPNFIGSSTA